MSDVTSPFTNCKTLYNAPALSQSVKVPEDTSPTTQYEARWQETSGLHYVIQTRVMKLSSFARWRRFGASAKRKKCARYVS